MEEKLISFVRKNRILWNKKSTQVKAKQRKWFIISKQLGVEVAVAKKRWRTLRDRFHREKSRLSSPENERPLTWKYYEQLTFLNYPDDSKDNVNPEEDNEIDREECKPTVTPFGKICPQLKMWDELQTEGSDQKAPCEDSLSSDFNSMCPKKRQLDGDRSSVHKEMCEFLNSAKGALQEQSSIGAFFSAMAMQVQEAKMPFHIFANLQLAIIAEVQDHIKQTLQENCSTPSRP